MLLRKRSWILLTTTHFEVVMGTEQNLKKKIWTVILVTLGTLINLTNFDAEQEDETGFH